MHRNRIRGPGSPSGSSACASLPSTSSSGKPLRYTNYARAPFISVYYKRGSTAAFNWLLIRFSDLNNAGFVVGSPYMIINASYLCIIVTFLHHQLIYPHDVKLTEKEVRTIHTISVYFFKQKYSKGRVLLCQPKAAFILSNGSKRNKILFYLFPENKHLLFIISWLVLR